MSALWDALSYLNPLPYLAMPGQYTRGILAGRPGERLEGRDLLRAWGLAGKQDDWNNFAGGLATDILTDPLTVAGAPLARMGMRAVAAALPVRSGMGKASSLFSSGGGAAARQRFGDMLGEVGVIRNPMPLAPGQQPLPGYVAPGIVGSGTTRLQAQAMRAPRPMVEAAWHNLPPGATHEQMSQAAQRAAEAYTRNTLRALGQDAGYLDMINPQSPVEALYDPLRRTITLLDNVPNAPPLSPSQLARNFRHERIHALVDTAATPEQMSRLPWPARWAATERAAGLADNNLSQISKAAVLEEATAHALENRSLMKQLQGAAAYLFHPGTNAVYSDMYRRAAQRGIFDPQVAEMYASLPQKFVEYPSRALQGAAVAAQTSQPTSRPTPQAAPPYQGEGLPAAPQATAPQTTAPQMPAWPMPNVAATPSWQGQKAPEPGPLHSAIMQPVDNSLRPQPAMPLPDRPPMDYQQYLRQNKEKFGDYNLLKSAFSQSPSFDMRNF